MKNIALLISAISAFTSAQSGGSTPACASTCLTSSTSANCVNTDIACLCADSAYTSAVTTCIKSSCTTVDDLMAAAAAAQGLCAAVGVPLAAAATPSSAPTDVPATPPTDAPATAPAEDPATSVPVMVLPASTPVEAPATTMMTSTMDAMTTTAPLIDSMTAPVAITTTTVCGCTNGTMTSAMPTAGMGANATSVMPYAGGAGKTVVGVVGVVAMGALLL